MAISSDWDIDFTTKRISHVDGLLTWDGGDVGETAPAAGDYVRGDTSGAVGKVLSGVNLGVTGPGGTGDFSLTNTVGRFEDGEAISVLSSLPFDNVDKGFEVGDTLYEFSGGGNASIVVYAFEYEAVAGASGTLYGTLGDGTVGATAFANNDILRVSSDTGATAALASAASVNNEAEAGFLVNEATNGTITAPTRSVIINYDTGILDFIRFSKVQDGETGGSPTDAKGLVEQTYGVQSTGSLRLVDVTGTWLNNDTIYVADKVFYDNRQTGQSFKLNDSVVGGTGSTASAAVGKIIDVAIGGATGTLTLLNQGGTFLDTEQVLVNDIWIANIEATAGDHANFSEQHALQDLAEVTTQLDEQGGLYADIDQINVVRDSNAFYTYLQDTFDELGALDDDVPMSAQVKLQQYTLINSWKIPDLSFRFLESGSIQDLALDNIWTNFQTLGSVNGIGDTAFAATTPQPQIYLNQNATGFRITTNVVDSWWIGGQIDILAKVKTSTDQRITLTATAGVNISGGTVTIFVRRFGDTYDNFETTTIAGVAPIPLATANDLDNTTGTHQTFYDGENAGPFLSGEEIVDAVDATKRGVITSLSDFGVTGTIGYILTSTTQFVNNDEISGQTSGATANIENTPTSLVAGYDVDVIFATAQREFPFDGQSATEFLEGEEVTVGTGATGILMRNNNTAGGLGSTGDMVIGNIQGSTGGMANNDRITGLTSGATADVNGTPVSTSQVFKDIGDGNGETAYNACVFLDRTGANPRLLADMYEWVKYRTRRQETAGEISYNLMGGANDFAGTLTASVAGQIYITLDTSYPLVKVSPVGSFAGGTFFGARGVFIQDMANTDVRNFQLIDENGVVRDPPNLQSLTVQGLISGDRVAVFRRPNATSGSGIDTTEFTLDGAVSASATSVTVNETPVASDHPTSGVLRLFDQDTGLFDSVNYSALVLATGVFTTSAVPNDYDSGNDAYVPLIQEQSTSTSVSQNLIYAADIPLLGRVRIRGILPFEVEGTFTATGATITAIRTSDTIVD